MCSCATDFVNNIFEKTEFAVRGLSRQHNLEVMKLCQPGHRQLRARISNLSSGDNDSCCGTYPKRFPFKTTDQNKLCCDEKIISKNRNNCCNGLIADLNTCQEIEMPAEDDHIFLYDERKDSIQDSATSAYETVFETYTATSTTSNSYETLTETGVTAFTENDIKEEYETYFYTTATSEDAKTTMTSTTFRGFTGPCSPNPCYNDGECIESANPDFPWLAYSCICPTVPIHFTGRNCQYGPCNPNPCINGGKCHIEDLKRTEYENIKCSCPAGFYGSFCELQMI
ncbi:unnamed protein product [Oikopleura dioica]|uniref:EGF-like domain-containing protein n=1 Tax=Oikopleura dioica TaxID=34765 RepID=E4XD62_OIKDI|nr:unnamed protein product [Oikopleura dioica]